MTPLYRLAAAGALCLFALPAAADKATFTTTCSTDPVVDAFTAEACGCLYDNIQENFSEEQMVTISTLFQGSPSEARERLIGGSEADQDIAARIDEIEDGLNGCDF